MWVGQDKTSADYWWGTASRPALPTESDEEEGKQTTGVPYKPKPIVDESILKRFTSRYSYTTATPVIKNKYNKIYDAYFIDDDGYYVDALVAGNTYTVTAVVEDAYGRFSADGYGNIAVRVTKHTSNSGNVISAYADVKKHFIVSKAKITITEDTPAGSLDLNIAVPYKYSSVSNSCTKNVKVLAKDDAYRTVSVASYEGIGSILPSRAVITSTAEDAKASFRIKLSGAAIHAAYDNDGHEIARSTLSPFEVEQTISIPVGSTKDTVVHLEQFYDQIVLHQHEALGIGNTATWRGNVYADTVYDVMSNLYFPAGAHASFLDFPILFEIQDIEGIDCGDPDGWKTVDGSMPVANIVVGDGFKSDAVGVGLNVHDVRGIPDTRFEDSKFSHASLHGCELVNCDTANAQAQSCKIVGGKHCDTTFIGCDITGEAALTCCNLYATELSDMTGGLIKLCDMRQCCLHDFRMHSVNEFGRMEGCVSDRVFGDYVYIASESENIFSGKKTGFKDYWMLVGIAQPEYALNLYDCSITRGFTDYTYYVEKLSGTKNAEMILLFDKKDGVDQFGVPYYIESAESKAHKEYSRLIDPQTQSALSKMYGKEPRELTESQWINLYWSAIKTVNAALDTVSKATSDLYSNRIIYAAADPKGYKVKEITQDITDKALSAQLRTEYGSSNEELLYSYAYGKLGYDAKHAPDERSKRDAERARIAAEKAEEARKRAEAMKEEARKRAEAAKAKKNELDKWLNGAGRRYVDAVGVNGAIVVYQMLNSGEWDDASAYESGWMRNVYFHKTSCVEYVYHCSSKKDGLDYSSRAGCGEDLEKNSYCAVHEMKTKSLDSPTIFSHTY